MGSGLEEVLMILEGSDDLKSELLNNSFSDIAPINQDYGYRSKIIKTKKKNVQVDIHSQISITSEELENYKNENLALVFLCNNEDKNPIDFIKTKREAVKELLNSVEAILYFKGDYTKEEKNENELKQFAETNHISFYNVDKPQSLDISLTEIVENCLIKAKKGSCYGF